MSLQSGQASAGTAHLCSIWQQLERPRGGSWSDGRSFTPVAGTWAGKIQISGDWNIWGSLSISLNIDIDDTGIWTGIERYNLSSWWFQDN